MRPHPHPLRDLEAALAGLPVEGRLMLLADQLRHELLRDRADGRATDDARLREALMLRLDAAATTIMDADLEASRGDGAEIIRWPVDPAPLSVGDLVVVQQPGGPQWTGRVLHLAGPAAIVQPTAHPGAALRIARDDVVRNLTL